ncbi:hypothetical protein EHS25_004312 [Saitozyma podzolica]|jgi:hypothetical protein|uniref:Uncharacterized protein n=1 Tax=Saitozyma podzolica TaxID=1890683 RepID=A0A427YTX2_9TREE|nr:hypothetical protein EHS25_004312 [Saitozyma podzolica]
MDRQLTSPLLITPVSAPTKLSSKQTFIQLQHFLSSLPSGPSRSQLERLTDSLGVEIGAILPSEVEKREAERFADRARRRAEKRKRRQEEREREEREGMEGMVEGLEEDGFGGADEEMEEGAVDFEGEQEIGDRGDVEYGDVVDEEDEDEPDNEHGGMVVDNDDKDDDDEKEDD